MGGKEREFRGKEAAGDPEVAGEKMAVIRTQPRVECHKAGVLGAEFILGRE